jgi:hypothetical protein
MNLFKALEWYAKGSQAEYSCGEDYASLIWNEENKLPKPSPAELMIAWEKYQGHEKDKEYQRLRASAYPAIQEQLDILYNDGIEGWMQAISNIKNKYPNPKDTKIKGVVMRKTALQEQIESLSQKVEALIKREQERTQSVQDFQGIVDEVNSGMSAIKGFMMLMPDIQKTLLEIKQSLPDNKIETKSIG